MGKLGTRGWCLVQFSLREIHRDSSIQFPHLPNLDFDQLLCLVAEPDKFSDLICTRANWREIWISSSKHYFWQNISVSPIFARIFSRFGLMVFYFSAIQFRPKVPAHKNHLKIKQLLAQFSDESCFWVFRSRNSTWLYIFFYYSQMLHITEAHQTQEQSESVVAESKWFKETA